MFPVFSTALIQALIGSFYTVYTVNFTLTGCISHLSHLSQVNDTCWISKICLNVFNLKPKYRPPILEILKSMSNVITRWPGMTFEQREKAICMLTAGMSARDVARHFQRHELTI